MEYRRSDRNCRTGFIGIPYLLPKIHMESSHDKELEELAARLAGAFGTTTYTITRDPYSESVYIAIEGLGKFPDDRIEAIAGPLLDEIDLEFEEIVLIPA
jgi:hypothetical protein